MMNLAKSCWFCAVVSVVVTAMGSGEPLLAQQPLEPNMVYERLMAVVPMIGAGTYQDPRRPAYVPDSLLNKRTAEKALDPNVDAAAASVDTTASQDGPAKAPPSITGFTYEVSDDGQFALITFQATDREAFVPMIEAAKSPGSATDSGLNRNALDGGFDLIVFEVGKADPADIQSEFQKHKKSFAILPVEVAVP